MDTKLVSKLLLFSLFCIVTFIGGATLIYKASLNIPLPPPETIISVPTSIFVPSNITTQMEALCDAIAVLPNSPLKSNLMAVIGTEYAGGSLELTAALQAFVQNQIRILERQLEGSGNKDL